MKQRILRQFARCSSEILVIAFMGIVTVVAHTSGLTLILFPEIAALSHDVLTRPRGRWASQPVRLVLTPTLTAVLGLFLTRELQYGALSMVLIVGLSLFIIKLTRSTIAPAISAGLLPMVLGERSWLYPCAIFLGLGMLVAVLQLWKRCEPAFHHQTRGDAEHSRVVEALEALPHDRFWAGALLLFLLVLGAIAEKTGLRLLVFPPLIVMAYELFGHPEVPRWMKRPTLFPVVCFLTATIGLISYRTIPSAPFAVMISVLGSIGILRLFKVHMPPALAVSLLPFVMTSPDYRFPLSVLLGTIALTVYFHGYGALRRAMPSRPRKVKPASPSTLPSSCS